VEEKMTGLQGLVDRRARLQPMPDVVLQVLAVQDHVFADVACEHVTGALETGHPGRQEPVGPGGRKAGAGLEGFGQRTHRAIRSVREKVWARMRARRASVSSWITARSSSSRSS